MSANGTPESVLTYYLAHRPAERQPTIDMWTPTLLQMLADGVTAKIAHAWILKHKDTLAMPAPALSTLRDWMTKIRNKKESETSVPSDQPDISQETPAKQKEAKPETATKPETQKTTAYIPEKESSAQELRRLDREMNNLPVDANFPELLIRLKIREYYLLRSEEPTAEQIRDYYPNIALTMRKEGFSWKAPD